MFILEIAISLAGVKSFVRVSKHWEDGLYLRCLIYADLCKILSLTQNRALFWNPIDISSVCELTNNRYWKIYNKKTTSHSSRTKNVKFSFSMKIESRLKNNVFVLTDILIISEFHYAHPSSSDYRSRSLVSTICLKNSQTCLHTVYCRKIALGKSYWADGRCPNTNQLWSAHRKNTNININ